ncbi:hypothetical protein ABTL43_19610, partial [Acinetobacter baumannii]
FRLCRYNLALLILICLSAPTFADDPPPWKPSKIIVCEEIQSANPAPICARTCAAWARSQPDFQVSLDACMANCQQKKETCHEVH